MAWTAEFAAEAEHDFGLIFDHLLEAYTALGDPLPAAFERAEARLEAIREAALTLASAPHRGTKRDAIAPGLRTVTIDRAVFWFDLDEKARKVRVLAIFFGGQDHQRHMLIRLLGRPG
jgi:plasmid stabilization system protein ParE